ncbi:hypothetical protein MACJ_002302 [Theileria orientalis]|uniref:Uncharacterized protein n=1 Tax=Theileria orientalis TaxID=68886 RepID=A0A976QSK6_THEOR|nr:hypothetical protein MACJ_002302 [Theileria orientalis]
MVLVISIKNARWDRAYNITAYTIKKSLKDQLDDEFKKLLFNRKIRFRIGKERKEISGDKQELGDYKNYRFIFLPVGNDSILGRECLFAIDFYSNKPIAPGDPDPNKPEYCVRAEQKDSSHKHEVKIEHKNKIDEYYLLPFNGQLYDGIMVYLARENGKPPETLCKQNEDNNNTALLLEFIDSCKSKTHIKRKDKEGFWWAEEKVDYKNDAELLEKLREIKTKLDSNVVTVILDKKVTYNGVQAFKPVIDKKAYNKYTHEYKDAKKPNLLFERKDPKIGSNSLSEITAKIVEVYYLKAKDAIVDDAQPFLIVFYEKESTSEIKKAYHFKNSDKFEEWIEFNGGKTEGLEKKLQKIEENLKCIADLKLLRYMAYQILIGEDPKTTKPKDTPTPSRPDEFVPPDQPKPLSIPLIVGGSVGGVVFVVSSAVGYGIYWYNTTIKLLT